MSSAGTAQESRIEVAFVDSRPVVGDLFVESLEQMRGIAVTGRCSHLAEALPAFSAEAPDVVIVGIGFIGMTIEEAVAEIHDVCPDVAVLAIVQREGDKDSLEAFAAGALGTFTIDISNRELQRRVRSAYARQVLLPADFASHVVALEKELPGDALELSESQAMVLSYARRGLSYAEAARRMGTSGHQVRQHLVSAYRTCREALRAGV